MRGSHAGMVIAIAPPLPRGRRPSDARTIRHGYVPPCSVFDKHPCMPTFCSVFDRNPCVPEPQYRIGQDLRLTVESEPATAMRCRTTTSTPSAICSRRLRACWKPPERRQGARRDGNVDPVQLQARRPDDGAAARHLRDAGRARPTRGRPIATAITAAFDRCMPLQFTNGLGGAIAGRPIAIRYVDDRTIDDSGRPKRLTSRVVRERSSNATGRNEYRHDHNRRQHADPRHHPGQGHDRDAAGSRAEPRRPHQGTGARGLLRRHRVSSRHRRLHGADRLPARHRHRRLRQEAQGRIHQGEACARHRLDGARGESGFRRQPVLHLLRRRALAQRPVHRVGRGDRRAWRTSTRSSAASRSYNPDKIVKAQMAADA